MAIVATAAPAMADPLFPNSVASNDLDFIRADDPGACFVLRAAGSGTTEMYDPRRETLLVQGAVHFDARFDGQTLRINLHPDVPSPHKRAQTVAAAVATLPVPMRSALRAVNVLDGDGSAWAEDQGRFFTVYDDLIARRLNEHDFNETVFHEAAHVALDPVISGDPDWAANQAADGGFITAYAADYPQREDIAETALFAWTMLYHPARLPPQVEDAVRAAIPHRLEYLGNMLEGFDPPQSCAPTS